MRSWADNADQVAARTRGSSTAFTPGIKNIALEGGLYGTGSEAAEIEGWFSKIETDWTRLVTNQRDEPSLEDDDRSLISLFIAIQIARSPDKITSVDFAANVFAYAGTESPAREQVADYLQQRHLGFPATAREVEAAWTFVTGLAKMFPGQTAIPRTEALGITMRGAIDKLVPLIFRYGWTVEYCRKRILITSDRPVSNWSKPHPLDQVRGIGLGNAEQVRLPLGPQHLLVLRPIGTPFRREEVQPTRFYTVNEDVASRCARVVIAAKHRARYLAELKMKKHGPTLRFNIGPGTRVLPDGTEQPMNDVLHMWTPRE